MPLSTSGVANDAVNEKAFESHSFPAADLEHPWLGLDSFKEESRAYFFGRDAEIAEIHLRFRSHPLLVLYGHSGLGKTSILNAGLIPRLREERQKPAIHRLVYKDRDPSPLEQLFYLLFYVPEQSEILRSSERISIPVQWWQTLSTKVQFPLPDDFASRLWLRLHWREEPPRITHLILDQFEEVFRLGTERTGAENEVCDALAILVQSAIPDPIVKMIAEHDEFLDHFDSDSAPLRVLLALRDDYVYALNRWKRSIPSIGQNNYELRSLRGPGAVDAVFEPGALRCRYRGEISEANETDTGLPPIVTKETAERIVRFVARKDDDVPIDEIEAVPPILSLLCRELNERRFTEPAGTAQAPAKQITFSETDTDVETIIKTFYERCMAGRPDAVRMFIEEELVSYSGARLAQDEKSILSCFDKGWRISRDAGGRRAPGYGDPDKARVCLEELVNQRLLTPVTGGENPSYELIHDLLAAVVEKSRLTREALSEAERLRLEQAKQRRKQRLTAALAGSLAIALLATIWGGYYAFVQEHKSYYREFAKHDGFPVGINKISESTVRRLPVSFRLTHKGIFRDGWKLHWKPAFRVEAVNGFLELTSKHSVFPYLWKGELESEDTAKTKAGEKGARLGLKTVCQWEFVPTTKNEIMYERALDRSGRMVYGLIYSPRGSLSPSTRLTRFVGPDGFPQLQRRSAAEYVEIHYDGRGWEDCVMYRDGKNLPAPGPDGAFGQSIKHDDRGRVTQLLSLNDKGQAVIDDAGNSGMQSKYDQKGNDIEDISVGTDLKLRPVKEGWVIRKNQDDRVGRVHRTTVYGIYGEQVLSKTDGCHGWEAEYDENGNQTVMTLLGLDGKAMPIADGYATVKLSYDAHGNVIRETFHSVKGEPVRHKDGYYGWDAEYDANGNCTVMTYIGLDGKPMPIGIAGREIGLEKKPTFSAGDYATTRMTYNSRGKMTGLRYYGVNGEPVVSKKDGYHGWDTEYDEYGNRTVVTYLGLDGKPMRTASGYATIKSAYDPRGNEIRTTYHGVNGEQVLHKDGYYGLEAEYDEHGNATAMTYLGPDGKPTEMVDGYATIKSSYDARDKITRTRFYGINDEAALSTKYGYHGFKADYDKRGNQTLVTYLGLNGKPMAMADGYATMKSTYDEHDHLVRQAFYGVDNEPVLSRKNSYHGFRAEYDERGNQTVVTYFGSDEKPTLMSDGFATMKSTYDARGNIIGQTFQGVDGEPIQHKNGYYGYKAEYDEHGNRRAVTYLGKDGKAAPIAAGYATFKADYDEKGKVTQIRVYGGNGEAVLSKVDGYHGRKLEYDESGNQTVSTYLGLDGKPMPTKDGYATARMTYDARGNMTSFRAYGLQGEPVVMEKQTRHGWDAEYDKNGNETVMTDIGKDGKPALTADGFATVKSTYDAHGKIIRKMYYGTNGEPIQSKDGYYGWEAEYDENGNQTVQTCFDKDGKPTPNADGYATMKSTFDARGNRIRQTFYGVNGEPVLSKKDASHGWEAEYDQQRNQTVSTYLGLDDKPMLIADGYATMRMAYDAHGHVI